MPDIHDPEHDALDGLLWVVGQVEYAHRSGHARRAVGLIFSWQSIHSSVSCGEDLEKGFRWKLSNGYNPNGKDGGNRVRKAVDCGTQEFNSASKTFEDLCKNVGDEMDST